MNTRGNIRDAVPVPVRAGMTLVELLVVTGLIAVFLGLVVTGVRGSRAQRKGAETLAAVLSSAQARALGVPEGAAAILSEGTAGGQGGAAACTALYDAVMQPLIAATVTGIPPGDPAAGSASATVTPTNGDDVQRAYRIMVFGAVDPRVFPPTAWFGFVPPETIRFRDAVGQTAGNTVWPKAAPGDTVDALLAQYPAKSSTLVELEGGVAVDLRFSGVGDERDPALAPYGRLDGKGAIAIVFDRIGRVAEVIQRVPEPGAAVNADTPQPAVPTSAIYFLVAPLDDITGNRNTLASDDASWVVLAPQTGRVFVADNVVQSGTDTAAVRAARAKARQGIGVGR